MGPPAVLAAGCAPPLVAGCKTAGDGDEWGELTLKGGATGAVRLLPAATAVPEDCVPDPGSLIAPNLIFGGTPREAPLDIAPAASEDFLLCWPPLYGADAPFTTGPMPI